MVLGKAMKCSRIESVMLVHLGTRIWNSEEDALFRMEKEGPLVTRSVVWLSRPLDIVRKYKKYCKEVEQIDVYHG